MWTMRTSASTRPAWWGHLKRGRWAATGNPVAAVPRKDMAFRLTLGMLGIIAAASLLRLHGLDRTSLWNDEAASWNMARRPFWTMILQQTGDNNPPLFDIILYAMMRLFGDSETMLRLPSALLGIANIYLLYRLGTVLWDRLTGVFAAALLAFSGFHVWYSQEARMYSLFCVTATAFALTTVLFVTAPTRTRALLCTLTGVALLYSHTYGPLVWVAIDAVVAIAMLTRAPWIAAGGRTWTLTQALIGASFLPWVSAILGDVKQVMQGFWIPYPTPSFLYWTFNSIAGGPAMLGCLGILVLLSFWPAAADRQATIEGYKQPASTPRPRIVLGWRSLLLLSWAILPFLIEYGVSVTGRPVIVSHYLISSLPPVLLLAARGLAGLRFNRPVLIGAGVIVFACALPGVYKSLVTAQREDFRAAVTTFSERFQNSDQVLFASRGARNAFDYYYRPPVAHEAVIGAPATNDDEVLGADRIWVFARSGIGHTTPLFEQIEAQYQESKVFDFYGLTLYLFARPCPRLNNPATC
jgi:mannosyltransferase